MKSRSEFNSDQEYKEYLLFYYSGLAMQSIAGFENQNTQQNQQSNARNTADTSVIFAQELIKILMPDKQ